MLQDKHRNSRIHFQIRASCMPTAPTYLNSKNLLLFIISGIKMCILLPKSKFRFFFWDESFSTLIYFRFQILIMTSFFFISMYYCRNNFSFLNLYFKTIDYSTEYLSLIYKMFKCITVDVLDLSSHKKRICVPKSILKLQCSIQDCELPKEENLKY